METALGYFLDKDVLYKLLLALLLGGVIGLEREWHGRAAGLRTHVLVCLGSTILIIAARGASASFGDASSGSRIVLDPNRIAAGIVTGIGFLGAGAILRMGDLVRGLTTAACVWFVAALGIVIGNGMYGIATVVSLMAVLILILFDALEHRIPTVTYRSFVIHLADRSVDEVEDWCRKTLPRMGIRILDVLHKRDCAARTAELTFHLRVRGAVDNRRVIDDAAALEGVRAVSWRQD